VPKKIQLILKWKSFDPGQVGHDNFHSITGGMNYYIHGDDQKLWLTMCTHLVRLPQ
jgi:hypothetical protein